VYVFAISQSNISFGWNQGVLKRINREYPEFGGEISGNGVVQKLDL
jgi:hypothetical protein